MKFKITRLRIIVFITYLWVLFQTWYYSMSVFKLHNFYIIDTDTYLQSLSSAIFSNKFFVNTVPGGSFFSVHASFILFLLLPFYSIYPNFIGLYSIQNIIIFSPTIPLFLLARKRLGDNNYSMLLALSYLIYPAITPVPFEAVTLFSGFAVFAYYFLDEDKKIGFIISFLLMLSTIEFNPFIGIAFFILILIRSGITKNILNYINKIFHTELNVRIYNSWRFYALFSLISSIVIMYLDIKFIAFASHGTHSALQNSYGTNILSLKNIITNIKTDTSSKINYAMLVNAPYLFLSLFDPVLILQFPWIGFDLISSFNAYWSYGIYYEAYLWPFAAIGAVEGLYRISSYVKKIDNKRIIKINPSRAKKLIILIFIVMLISWAYQDGIGYSQNMPVHINIKDQQLLKAISPLNESSSVFTSENNMPVVELKSWDTWFYGNNKEYFILNATSGSPPSGYGVYDAAGRYVLFKKGYDNKPLFNDLNYTRHYNIDTIDQSFNVLVFNGNYTVKLYLKSDGYNNIYSEGKSSNETKYFPVNTGIIIPFNINKTMKITYIYTDYPMTYGYYTVNSAISRNESRSSIIDYSNYTNYASSSEKFYYNIILNPGTYYFWIYSSGYPGGIYIPVSHGSSKLIKIDDTGTELYNYNLTSSFTITSFTKHKNVEYSASSLLLHASNLSVNRLYKFKSYYHNGTYLILVGLRLNETSLLELNNPEIIITVTSDHADPYNNIFLDNTLIPLMPFIIGGIIAFIIPGYKKDHRRLKRISGLLVPELMLIFGIIFAYGYLNIIRMLYNVYIFAAFGISISILLLIYLYIYYSKT
ncbi:DUF2079 domain-containing protein [Picrophilus oshimae]|uniref:Hypothetical membrane spanning protein n=1 Tax=Picrophilus torridus (strain ATCC 700027 / DSM 9790 / JCM 10055 / NBRC 100828 / KAW 2/3) TaxID=1122961 RepID=Q6L2C3_PICTO|nr:DUF2079 domain-containing protein [Picrophilus oshimae]AAT42879.1 hypothetical membrane spanning protein [Picrophilus oshimae DSM 9789]